MRMCDRDIRLALREHLARQYAQEPDTLVLDELGLCQGVARIDIAVVNGTLNGYEIKSEADTLSRLAGQQDIYNRTLDFVTIVSSRRHMAEIRRQVPSWWGLCEARCVDGGVQVRALRKARRNPSVDPKAVVQLVWRDEALAMLTNLGVTKGLAGKPRKDLWAMLAGHLPAEELCRRVRNVLKGRSDWRSDAPRIRRGDSCLPVSMS